MERKTSALKLNYEGLLQLIYPRKFETVKALIIRIREAHFNREEICFEELALERFGKNKQAANHLSRELRPLRDIGLVQVENGKVRLSYDGVKQEIIGLDRSFKALVLKQ